MDIYTFLFQMQNHLQIGKVLKVDFLKWLSLLF